MPPGTGKKIKWTEEEDLRLRGLVEQYGTKKWSYISTPFDNKGSKQCRRRWQNRLSMDAKNTSWTSEEDNILLKGHKKLGNRWTEIAKQLSGRTDNAVKNRFFALRKKKQRGSGGRRAARNGAGVAKVSVNVLGTKTKGVMKPSGLQRKGSSGIKSLTNLSIDIPGQGQDASPGKTVAINLPKDGLSRDDLCLIDQVNLLNTPLQIAVQDAMNMPSGSTDASGGSGSGRANGGSSTATTSTSHMSKFKEFLNWVFAPDSSLFSSRGNGSSGKDSQSLTPLFNSDFNFAIIPESVRGITRHLLTKQFAHIWTPRAGSFDSGGSGSGTGTGTTPSGGGNPGGFTPVSLRRSPRFLGQNANMDFVGMKVPSPTFSDNELEMMLNCISPAAANNAKKGSS